MDNTLKQIFQRGYSRQSFIDNIVIPIFQPTVKQLNLYSDDALGHVELTEIDKKSATSIIKYGEFITHDDRTVELYDVTLTDNKNIAISRVGIGSLIKSRIISNNAVLVNFHHHNTQNTLWRFSFIAYDSFFEQGEVQIKETNPKRYTYVFGDAQESYRTAIDRFNVLKDNLKTTINDLQNAFAVEAMSKAFFDEYRETHYQNFVRELTGEEWQKKNNKLQLVKVQEPSTVLNYIFKGNKKQARNFCKKLLGQIVFLYFLQKKGWLGASDTNYTDGDKNFMQNFYQQAGADDGFYTQWLCPLFYDTLNEKRNKDDFTMPDGTTVKIPFLNGGLFDKEINNIELMTFPPDLFTNLFEFFNRFNFTIYENSPEEHTIAIDPEMLGHIFENLLEDNKDKGAFYTPKPIVQYMTQESLIQYLLTHIGEQHKKAIENFVKNKDKQNLEPSTLKDIDKLLDEVKICDPAIGSGAFPMGLLQEIFTLKEQIAYDLGFEVWSPATVKENIIQNSIYGVDIEKGAVDIARLRFWLSLVVDEKLPKPLPNLAYKIVVGNSLVSQFEQQVVQIDWDVKEKKEMGTGDLFANSFKQEDKIIQLLEQISQKQNQYFIANKSEKTKLKKQIRNLKLDIIGTQLQLMIDSKGIQSNSNKRMTKAEHLRATDTKSWKVTLESINALKKNNKPFNHFDWQLDFPEILNPIINKDPNQRGFDIVIANPPYVGVKGNKDIFNLIKKGLYSKYLKGRSELFYFFMYLALDISKLKGINTFITTNYYITSTDGYLLRDKLNNSTTLLSLLNFNELKLFSSALGQHNMITIFRQGKYVNEKASTLVTSEKGIAKPNILNKIFNKNSLLTKYFRIKQSELFESSEKYIRIEGKSGESKQLERIFCSFNNCKLLGEVCEVKQGLRTGIDRISKQHELKFNYNGDIGSGVFILSKKEINNLGYKSCNEIIKPLFKNSDINHYFCNTITQYYILYIDKNISEEYIKANYPTIYQHLLNYKDLILKIRGVNNESSKNWFRLDRSRKESLFQDEKICAPQRSYTNRFGYNIGEWYASADVYFVKSKDSEFKLSYIASLLNSKLFYIWFYKKGKRKGEMLELYQKPLSEAPIKETRFQNIFGKIFDYLIYLKFNHEDSIIFENLINSLVYELYFPNLIQQNNCEVIKYLGELPELPKDKSEKHKRAIIDEFMQRISNKNHKVYQNSRKMRQIDEIILIEQAYPQPKQQNKKKI